MSGQVESGPPVNPPDEKWYCAIAGKQYGPISQTVLCSWIVEGRVKPHDYVWSIGLGAWKLAREVAEFAGLCCPEIPPMARGAESVPAIITTPLLVSAIVNCVAAMFWLLTIFGIVFTAGLVVLLVFEFMLYSDLRNPGKTVTASRVRTIAICEIIAGLVSLAPLVSGIIILTNLDHVDLNRGKRP